MYEKQGNQGHYQRCRIEGKEKVIIIGAGPAGITAGYELLNTMEIEWILVDTGFFRKMMMS